MDDTRTMDDRRSMMSVIENDNNNQTISDQRKSAMFPMLNSECSGASSSNINRKITTAHTSANNQIRLTDSFIAC